jgi:8-oxo-dGTP pyrophosphatase MutT (NUDIX family)
VNPALAPHLLRDWITSRLDPLDSFEVPGEGTPRYVGSDHDFDPYFKPADHAALAPAAVLTPLIEHEGGISVLLTRRADKMRKHSGQVAFPGGRCDPGETPVQTALREAQEEIGLDPSLVTVAGLSSPYRTGTGFHVTPVVGFIKPGFLLTPNPAEVADVFETPFAFLMNPGNHERRHADMPDGARRHYYAMPYENWHIWGATAGMLRALYVRLYGEADERAAS